MVGCATAPKAVITAPEQASAEELKRLKLAGEEYSLALKSMWANKYDEAEKSMLALTSKYPDFPGPYANLGIIYTNTGHYDKAEKYFNSAIEKNSDLSIIHNQMGFMYRKSGKFDKSLESYQKALDLNPDYPEAHYNIGILYDLYMKDYEKALDHYKKYQSLTNPSSKDPVAKWIFDLSNRLGHELPKKISKPKEPVMAVEQAVDNQVTSDTTEPQATEPTTAEISEPKPTTETDQGEQSDESQKESP
jgi:tetratricopeptide (TPR) repeat protein